MRQKREAAGAGGAAPEVRDAYVAIFCPHCGQHINEVDEQDTPEERTQDLGSLYTCGWCGIETRDWNHVLSCRRTAKARAAFSARQQAAEDAATFRRTQARLRSMLDELSD